MDGGTSAAQEAVPGAPGRHLLDDPVGSSLAGPHRALGLHRGRAARYPADVSPFMALPHDATDADWADLAALAGPDAAVLFALPRRVAADWRVEWSLPGVQMVDAGVDARPDPEAVELGPGDVDEVLELVRRTQPGPFEARTLRMGRYLGIRRGGALVAMAGERMRPEGWTEISAVCTDPAHRGRGLAARLVLAVAAGIRERGATPFLHATAENRGAIRLYASLGFELRRELVGTRLYPPA